MLCALSIAGLAALAQACIEPSTTSCGELICPADKVCDENRTVCVLPGQLAICAEMVDGTACSFPGEPDGICDHGICHASECADGLVSASERCDDGNTVDGDGCSGNCSSEERCGNAVVDVAIGESCDDGGFRSGDGCSSACTVEVASWHEFESRQTPGFYGHELAYDSARERVVVFGGVTPTGDTMDRTSELYETATGLQWEDRPRRQPPPSRESYLMVYDAAEHRIVMFGGNRAGNIRHGDTWVYDGMWSQLAIAEPPSARTGVAGAYDAERGNVVMFGGDTATGTVAETWVLDGDVWTQRLVAGPPARRDHRMAYSAKRKRVVLFGGYSSSASTTPLTDTWEWDGTAWQSITTTDAPTEVGAMAYDATGEQVVLFGGHKTKLDETWLYDGDWMPVVQATKPAARRRAAMAYDPVRGRIVLVGGTDKNVGAGGPGFEDTWEFDGTWTAAAAAAESPPRRNAAGWVFDTTRGVMVLAGGSQPPAIYRGDTWLYDGSQWLETALDTGPPTACSMGTCTTRMVFEPFAGVSILVRSAPGGLETWTFDGARWAKLATTGAPGNRSHFSLAYDRARKRVVLFGGEAMMTVRNDTWELDGSTWTERTLQVAPPARAEAAMAYDSTRHKVVLFGGRTGPGGPGQGRDDTWEYDGTTWSQVTTASAPSPRFGAAISFHEARGRAIVFGGESPPNPFADTWEYDGATWSEIVAFEGPPPRKSPHLLYDPVRKLVVLHGGDPQQDTWELVFRSTLADELCDNAADDDQDRLIDCEDPDCDAAWCGIGNQVCSAGVCACVGVAETRCGDGFDDDCDGAIDCADAECATTALCGTEIDCHDDSDDDGDQRTDCADPGCIGVTGCEVVETTCTGGDDNDGDGAIDCADPDCFLIDCDEVAP